MHMQRLIRTALAGLVLFAGIAVAAPAAHAGQGTRYLTVQNRDGRWEHFWIGTRNEVTWEGPLWHQWQLPGTGYLSEPESLGGFLTSGIDGAQNADGRLEIFGRGYSGDLIHIYQHTAGSGWSGWSSLGGILTTAPAVAQNADGRLEVFTRAVGGDLVHMWQLPTGGWSTWSSLDGRLDATMDPLAWNDAGRIKVQVRGVDNALHTIRQTGPNCCWSGWE